MLKSQTLVAQKTIAQQQCLKSKADFLHLSARKGTDRTAKEEWKLYLSSEDLGGTPPKMSQTTPNWGTLFHLSEPISPAAK